MDKIVEQKIIYNWELWRIVYDRGYVPDKHYIVINENIYFVRL